MMTTFILKLLNNVTLIYLIFFSKKSFSINIRKLFINRTVDEMGKKSCRWNGLIKEMSRKREYTVWWHQKMSSEYLLSIDNIYPCIIWRINGIFLFLSPVLWCISLVDYLLSFNECGFFQHWYHNYISHVVHFDQGVFFCNMNGCE